MVGRLELRRTLTHALLELLVELAHGLFRPLELEPDVLALDGVPNCPRQHFAVGLSLDQVVLGSLPHHL